MRQQGEEVKSMEKKTEVPTTGDEGLSVTEMGAQRAQLLPDRLLLRRRRRWKKRQRIAIFPIPRPPRRRR
jgi:hypothetical protein